MEEPDRDYLLECPLSIRKEGNRESFAYNLIKGDQAGQTNDVKIDNCPFNGQVLGIISIGLVG